MRKDLQGDENAEAGGTRDLLPTAPRELIPLLESDDPAVRGEAGDRLASLQNQSVDVLGRAVREGNERASLLALHTLIRIGGEGARRSIQAVLSESQDTNLLHAAIDGCAHLGIAEAEQTLITLVRGEDAWLRVAAIQALCQILGPALIETADADFFDDSALQWVVDHARISGDPSWILPLLEIVSGSRCRRPAALRRDAADAMACLLERAGDEHSLESARRLVRHLAAESTRTEIEPKR